MPGCGVGGNHVESGNFAGRNAKDHSSAALDGKDADMIPPDWEFFLIFAVKIVGLGIVVIVLHNVLKLIVGQGHF
jgi:hypothetical protein